MLLSMLPLLAKTPPPLLRVLLSSLKKWLLRLLLLPNGSCLGAALRCAANFHTRGNALLDTCVGSSTHDREGQTQSTAAAARCSGRV